MTEKTKQPEELHLIQIAMMTGKKGHRYTLEAFQKALVKCPNMTLTFVGTDKQGEKRSISKELHQMIDQTPVAKKVTFIPRISFNKLYDFLSDFDLFIHPSVRTPEMDTEGGAPIVLLDAEAIGMPVLATTHCDIPDEVIHEQTGILVPERNVELLANAIQRFYHMGAQEYQRFSQAGLDHVKEYYDIQKNAQALRNVYQEVL